MRNTDTCIAIKELPQEEKLYFERREGARYQTTILVQGQGPWGAFSVRGDINADGYVFLPMHSGLLGEKIGLAVRLPGLGEWIECTSVVQGLATRGTEKGIVGRIVETDVGNINLLLLWQELSASPLARSAEKQAADQAA